jgi:bisphosphoglycerate-independent phosphoglycerate mutase (AlkP superfamily)
VYQDLTKVDLAIENGSFFSNPALVKAVETAKQNGSALHIMGLLSPGGVHSHEAHIHAMVELAAATASTRRTPRPARSTNCPASGSTRARCMRC